MFKSKPTLMICCLAAIFPFILYIYLYPSMPDIVPIHYTGSIADRFVMKSSFEVVLLSGIGVLGFIFMKLLQLLLRKVFLRSYIENLAVVSRIWNVATMFVTLVLAAISIYALMSMV